MRRLPSTSTKRVLWFKPPSTQFNLKALRPRSLSRSISPVRKYQRPASGLEIHDQGPQLGDELLSVLAGAADRHVDRGEYAEDSPQRGNEGVQHNCDGPASPVPPERYRAGVAAL